MNFKLLASKSACCVMPSPPEDERQFRLCGAPKGLVPLACHGILIYLVVTGHVQALCKKTAPGESFRIPH